MPNQTSPHRARLDEPASTQRGEPQARQADTLVEGSSHGLGSTLILIANTQVKLWKALLFSMFIAGFAAALTFVSVTGSNEQSEAASSQTRYLDPVFSSVKITRDIPYLTNSSGGGSRDFFLDFYEPAGDTLSRRPLVVWIHGGGFVGGDKAGSGAPEYAKYFAERGYVAASINYRLNGPTPKGVHEAQSDAEAAIEFLCSRADTYRVDCGVVAVGGSSAGAVTALNVGYHYEHDSIYVTSDTLWNSSPRTSSRARAVIDVAGQVEQGLMSPGDPGVIVFHGTADPTVPYSAALAIQAEAEQKGIPIEFNAYPGAGHTKDLPHAEIMQKSAAFLYRMLGLGSGGTPAPEPPPSCVPGGSCVIDGCPGVYTCTNNQQQCEDIQGDNCPALPPAPLPDPTPVPSPEPIPDPVPQPDPIPQPDPVPAPTLQMNANPERITFLRRESVISWSSEHADHCQASGGWSGDKPLIGPETVKPRQTTVYTLTCTGEGGIATKSVTVKVGR